MKGEVLRTRTLELTQNMQDYSIRFPEIMIEIACFIILYKNYLAQVLVASLGTIIDCQGLSEALEDFGGTATLTYSEFEQYLSREVFSSLSDSLGRKELSTLESKIDEACWIISKSKLLADSLKRSPRVDSDNIFKLFRIFCLLADLVRDAETDIAQVLHHFTQHYL